MGIRVQQALLSSLLIAVLFSAPYLQTVRADEEVASSTEEVIVGEVASTTEEVISDSDTVIAAESDTPTVEAVSPLPTGVLFDNSYVDQDWSIDIHHHGHYVYLFRGYEEIANPPVLSTSTSWTTTGTTTYARIQRAGDTTCNSVAHGGTGGLLFFGPNFENYSPAYFQIPGADEKFCDFVFPGEGIPPGTLLSMAVIGRNGTSTIAGSSFNPGTSLDGSNSDPVAGGFAFQLCGIDGCSGGFASSTPPEPEGPKISNVLFLPGIKGSRLYADETRCGVIGCDNKLWDPLSSEDVRDLYLTPDGKSSRSDIYAKEGDVIDSIPGKRIYASFIEDMNALQASSTYNGGEFKWKAAAYDWRLSLEDIINNGVDRDGKIYYEEASSTPYIEQTLRQLVASSTTGKVTIIAHSNGGLVAKALLKKLGDVETAKLIDKIIFVGVPQSGAPQALGSLLFGDREGLPFDILPIIATPAAARGLAEYSPMAYHLMPSARYLSDTQDPHHSVIGFSGSVLYGHELSAYGSSVDTITELDDFLLAREGGRVKPDTDDSTSANVLNAGLISYANTTHDSLDSWTPPEGVTLYQIAGWGANTISGVDFYDEQKVLGTTIGYKRQYRPIFVEDGDGVVPVPSALLTRATGRVLNYWINLQKARVGLTKYDHGNILEIPALKNLISNLISNTTPDSSEIAVPSQPQNNEGGKKLIFQLHSPLTLGIHDSAGNYTGLNSDGSVSEDVSGTEYGEFGDVKYLIAPAGKEYTLALHGQSTGTFSLDIQEQTGDTVTVSTTIANVPTTAQTTASLTTTNGVADASSLRVDEDGNGSTDIELAPAAGETTTYTAPSAKVADASSSTSSGTRPTSHSSAELVTVAMTNPATVFQIPAVAQSRKQAYTVASTQIQDPVFESTNSPAPSSDPEQNHTQTASVYDAFAPITHLIQSFLHNVWSIILRVLTSIH